MSRRCSASAESDLQFRSIIGSNLSRDEADVLLAAGTPVLRVAPCSTARFVGEGNGEDLNGRLHKTFGPAGVVEVKAQGFEAVLGFPEDEHPGAR